MLVYIYTYINKNANAFYDNPFVYGASQMGNIECTCTQQQEDKVVVFRFNETDMWVEQPAGAWDYNLPDLNNLSLK